MPLGGVGFGAAAVTSFDAEGLIDVPKLPEFQSCPALAELVREAPTYGLDPTAAVSYAVGIIANLAGERFDVRKPKAPASVSVHLPMPVVVLNASGAGKSTLHDTVALGALFILRSRNAAVQLAAARFEHEYKAYVAACKKSNTHPKECKNAEAGPSVRRRERDAASLAANPLRKPALNALHLRRSRHVL
jgi:hypothetical protein